MSQLSLESISLFSHLTPEERELVRPIFFERDYPANSRVITENEAGRELFILVKGKVRIVKTMLLPSLDSDILVGKNPSKVLATLTGEVHPVFGEMGLVSDSPRSATVETLEESSFLVTDRERFFGLVEQEPRLGTRLLASLCERMAEMVRSSNAEVMKLTTALALILSGRR
jgi:CRP/FNR family cyclic AMP-dependent transcriptional regulator